MTIPLSCKLISSLEKCFPDEAVDQKRELDRITVLHGQRLCFQMVFRTEELINDVPFLLRPVIRGALAPYVRVRQVEYVPSLYPSDPTNCDEDYLRHEPGLYPDPIRPLYYQGCTVLYPQQLGCLWLDAMLPADYPEGEYPLTVALICEKTKETLAEKTLCICVAKPILPKQATVHTEWFYTDCLANHYHVKAFSEKHWRIIENYLRTAVENGINMILTPLITPELDTYVGGERLSTQLVDIEVTEDGTYRFGFDKLDRWITLCNRVGVDYFEMPHFFSQWGAKSTPKILARVKGRTKRIFGWETDALGEEYKRFLEAFLPELIAYLEKKQVAQRCFFHISDEPKLVHLAHYTACRDRIAPYLKQYPIIDALSSYAFAEKGVLSNPIPAVQHIQPFLEASVTPLWTYYSGAHGCSQYTGRYLSMPSARTRIIGVQMYMAGLQGFLHWGYNFWNTKFSYEAIDPRLHTDCGGFNPSGDCFLVYPGNNGEAWESLRLNAMREAMEDIRLLTLHESCFDRQTTCAMLLEVADGVLNFKEYPRDALFFTRLQQRVLADIAQAT